MHPADRVSAPRRLTRTSGFTGIDGAYRLVPDGTTDRALAILEVQEIRPHRHRARRRPLRPAHRRRHGGIGQRSSLLKAFQ